MYVSALMELFVFCEREINIYPRCDGKIGERLFCQIKLTGETSRRRWQPELSSDGLATAD